MFYIIFLETTNNFLYFKEIHYYSLNKIHNDITFMFLMLFYLKFKVDLIFIKFILGLIPCYYYCYFPRKF